MNSGKRKFWTLSYADDAVLAARIRNELIAMIKRFLKYLENKNLIINVAKTKILRFS